MMETTYKKVAMPLCSPTVPQTPGPSSSIRALGMSPSPTEVEKVEYFSLFIHYNNLLFICSDRDHHVLESSFKQIQDGPWHPIAIWPIQKQRKKQNKTGNNWISCDFMKGKSI